MPSQDDLGRGPAYSGSALAHACSGSGSALAHACSGSCLALVHGLTILTSGLSPQKTYVLSQLQTSVLSQQQTSILSPQQTSASAFIIQHQHLVSKISILWRLRQQPTFGYYECRDIMRPCATLEAHGTVLACFWTKFQAKLSILDPLRAKFDVFGRDRSFGQPGLDLGFLLLRQDICLSSSHLSCLNSRHLSCLNRRHLSLSLIHI